MKRSFRSLLQKATFQRLALPDLPEKIQLCEWPYWILGLLLALSLFSRLILLFS